MSTLPDNDFNLEKLFLPAWAQQEPSAAKYAKYDLPEDRGDRRSERRGPRPPRREGFGPRRDDGRPRGDRRPGQGGGDAGRERHGDPRGGPRPDQRDDRRERREPPAPLPEINVSLVPDAKGVESLARQIRMTGRAYPLFDIAQMILQKPERHTVTFAIKKNAEGKPVHPLFLCALDDSLWLSEDDAVAHVLRKHFDTFYQTERTPTEPPKGKYTFVAQCGISGIILGPPNHHDYQNQLRRLHTERFSRMPFEMFKSRVKIVREEEVVKKWVEDQSFRTEFVTLNMPEAQRLDGMEAVEKHFRETHRENIIKQVESHTISGVAARSLRCQELARAARSMTEDQRRFPLQIATVLSQQFAGHGLQFFKVNKTVTHVCIARPHFLDLAAAPVSEGVKKIVEFINTRPRCTRKVLVEALAPSPAPSATPTPAAPTEGAPAAAPADESQPTPEQTTVITDLHWLIHQGHVIEFANGVLETAKRPAPKPPRPEPKPAPAQAQAAAAGATVPEGQSPAGESQPPAAEVATGEAQPAPEGSAPASPAPEVTEQAGTSAEPTGSTDVSAPSPSGEEPSPADAPATENRSKISLRGPSEITRTDFAVQGA